MQTIHKQQLRVDDAQTLFIPKGSTILCVQTQHDVPCVWYRIEDTEEMQVTEYAIFTFGTGHPMEILRPDAFYISTYQLHDGDLVFHVFGEKHSDLDPSGLEN